MYMSFNRVTTFHHHISQEHGKENESKVHCIVELIQVK